MIEDNNPFLDPESKAQKKNNSLLILSAFIFLISFLFVSTTLFIYHQSGDIYLDRSRPGFLPERKEQTTPTPHFSERGIITKSTLEKYINDLDRIIFDLDQIDQILSTDPLSDKNLHLIP